jgi:tetratricopeptide (TPR) repeat protein
MPFTFNGVGTTYYGQKNLETYAGVCRHCKRHVNLQAYETRLWGVVLFIPILPLGKKQILDYCPRCTRHTALSMADWQRFGAQRIAEAGRASEQDPDSPEAAIEQHRTAVAFHQYNEADRAAARLQARFPDHPDVLLHVGQWHEWRGRAAEADACFEQALALNPDSKRARRAAGIARLRAGQVDEARQLLAFMESPGADRDPDVLILLGQAYQDQGRHADALDVFQHALDAKPALAKDRKFRKRARKSEKLAPEEPGILPPLPLHRSPVFVGAAVLTLVLLAVALINHLTAGRPPLHIVNGFDVPVTVELDGGDPVKVRPHGRRVVDCGGGRHRACVTLPDGSIDKSEFTVRAAWADRIFGSPVFVFNPCGAAAVVWQQMTYSDRPITDDAPDPYRVHVGQTLVSYRGVDYLFRAFPETITTKRSGAVTKTRVTLLEWEPADVIGRFANGSKPEDVLQFAESHLNFRPDDGALLTAYALIAGNHDQIERCREFLAAGLSHRPVRIEWHRHYQSLCTAQKREEETRDQYDRFLRDDPNNAALLYLRGRLAPGIRETMDYCDRAIAADPNLAYPWHAKAYNLRAQGDFAAARKAAQKACNLMPDHEDMAEGLRGDRLVLGEYDALEEELRTRQEKEPLLFTRHAQLLEVLAAKGDLAATRREHDTYAARLREKAPEEAEEWVCHSKIALLRQERRFGPMIEAIDQLADPAPAEGLRLEGYLGMGRPDKAGEELGEDPQQHRYAALLTALGYSINADSKNAGLWYDRARHSFAGGAESDARTAALLDPDRPLAMDEVRDLAAEATPKATVLVALADQRPAHRAELLALAEKLNAAPWFPHDFLKKAIKTIRSRKE